MGLNGPGTLHGSGTGYSNDYWSADWFWNWYLTGIWYLLDKGALVTQRVTQDRRQLNFIS